MEVNSESHVGPSLSINQSIGAVAQPNFRVCSTRKPADLEKQWDCTFSQFINAQKHIDLRSLLAGILVAGMMLMLLTRPNTDS